MYEQLEKLIKDIKKSKQDLESTDLDVLDKDQLNELANECLSLLPIVNRIAKDIDQWG